MVATFKQPGDIPELIAPSGGTTRGTAFQRGVGIVGVPAITAAAAAKVNATITGIHTVTKVTAEVWAEGDPIYWDETAKLFTLIGEGANIFAGLCTEANAGTATGDVSLGRGSDQKKVVSVAIPVNADLADGAIFIADRGYRVVAASEIHAVVGSDGGAVNVDVKNQTGTEGPTGGSSVLAVAFDLKAAANTVVLKAGADLTATAADLLLAKGDRLSIDFTGTLTAVAGLVVTVELVAA